MENKIEERPTICEFGIGKEGRLYNVERPFLIETKAGPPVKVDAGSLVWLSQKFGQEMFLSSKVTPVELSSYFEILREFRTVQNGEWLDLKKGDLIKLEREEALPLLRQNLIKEVASDEVDGTKKFQR